MKKKENQNKTIKTIIIKKTPGHISYLLLNAVGHTRTSTWVYWTTKTTFRMAVVASLHSDTAAAYIHMFFFFVLFFCLEMREEEQRRRLRLSGRRARRSGWRTAGDYWRKHGGTFLSWGRGWRDDSSTFFFLFSFRWIIFFSSPSPCFLRQTLASL